jgi:hypothetical protein
MGVISWLNDPFLLGFHVTCAQIFKEIAQLRQILRDMRVKSADSRDMHAEPEENLRFSLAVVDQRWRWSVGYRCLWEIGSWGLRRRLGILGAPFP